MYKIQAEGEKFVLFDQLGYIMESYLIGDCLEYIAREEDIPEQRFSSESELLTCIRFNKIHLKLLEEDGLEMSW